MFPFDNEDEDENPFGDQIIGATTGDAVKDLDQLLTAQPEAIHYLLALGDHGQFGLCVKGCPSFLADVIIQILEKNPEVKQTLILKLLLGG